MNARWQVARLLVSLLFFALVFTLYFRPRADVSPTTTLAIILAIELGAMLAGSKLGAESVSKGVLQTLLIAAGLSFFLVYFLKPTAPLSYDQAFLAILAVEIAGLAVSGALVRLKADDGD
jgi:hypothetical protein